MESMPNNEQLLQQHKLQLKTLQEKCDLQGVLPATFRRKSNCSEKKTSNSKML